MIQASATPGREPFQQPLHLVDHAAAAGLEYGVRAERPASLGRGDTATAIALYDGPFLDGFEGATELSHIAPDQFRIQQYVVAGLSSTAARDRDGTRRPLVSTTNRRSIPSQWIDRKVFPGPSGDRLPPGILTC